MTEKEVNGMPKKFDFQGDLPTSHGEKITKKMYDRYLGYGESISLWKKVAFILFVSTISSIGMNVYLSSRNTVVPYVVTITSTGEVLDVGKVNYITTTPTESQIIYFLNRVIKNIREIPYDAREFARRVNETKSFLAPNVYNKVFTNSLYQEVSGSINSGETRNVEIKNYTKLENGSGLFVIWEELTINKDGYITNKATYQSIVNYSLVKSENLEEIKNNPLGIIITNMSTKVDTK